MSYTLYYHGACKGFLGRAHGPLMILNHSGATFEIKAKPEAPTDTTGFAVPMCTFPGGFTIGQQGAICAALGKALDLYPSTPEGEAIAHNLVENMMDLLSDMGKADAARMGKWLGTFEAALTKSGSGFLVGDKLTYADLACFKILEAAAATGKAETPALLATWLAMMAGTDGAKKVAAMGVPMMP